MKISAGIFSIALISGLTVSTPVVWAQSPPASVAPPAIAVATAGKLLKAGVAKVVDGDVRVLDAQGVHPLESGDAVFASDRLLSGKQGAASVVLRDGTTLVLGANSQLQIQAFAFDATTNNGNLLVNLMQGSMRMMTGLISKLNPEAIQIKAKTLLLGVRGTDFIVETEESL